MAFTVTLVYPHTFWYRWRQRVTLWRSKPWYGLVARGASFGVPPGTVLTSSVGNLVSSSVGQTIDSLDLVGTVNITHNNVTLKRCHIAANDFYPVHTGGTATGVIIEDCTIDGGGVAQGCVLPEGGGGTIIRRCDISNGENGILIGENNMQIRNNYIHGLRRPASSDPHIDGIQGSGGFTSLVIDGNTVVSWDTSCIILQNEGAAFSGVQITNNTLIIDPALGGASCILCQDLDTGIGAVSGVTVTGNRMQKGTGAGQTYGFFHNVTGLSWSGNVDHLTGATINPDIG